MSRAAAIGEEMRLAGYGLAGVEVLAAEDAVSAHAAWESLGPDVDCVILTPAARAALVERLAERPSVLWTVVAR